MRSQESEEKDFPILRTDLNTQSHSSVKSEGATGTLSLSSPSYTKPLQSPKLVQIPPRLRTWSRTALYIFMIFGALVSFVPWTQTVTVQGNLSAYSPTERPQEIHAQINGSIRTWHVNEGLMVKKGDLILELADVNPQFMAHDLLERLDQSREALEGRRQAALESANILAEQLKEMSTLTLAATTSAEARVSEAEQKVQSGTATGGGCPSG